MADTEQTALAKANDNIQEVSIESVKSDIKSLIYVVRNQQVMTDDKEALSETSVPVRMPRPSHWP